MNTTPNNQKIMPSMHAKKQGNNHHQPIDINTIQQTIMQNIKNGINQHINTKLQQELSPIHIDLASIKGELSKQQETIDQKITTMQTDIASILAFMSSLKNGDGMRS